MNEIQRSLKCLREPCNAKDTFGDKLKIKGVRSIVKLIKPVPVHRCRKAPREIVDRHKRKQLQTRLN